LALAKVQGKANIQTALPRTTKTSRPCNPDWNGNPPETPAAVLRFRRQTWFYRKW
jgi:hypothetical protein